MPNVFGNIKMFWVRKKLAFSERQQQLVNSGTDNISFPRLF